MKTSISTLNAPKATGPFSQAIKINNFIYTSGQIYLTTDGKLLEGTIEEKTRKVIDNLKNILNEAGYGLSDVIKTTIYVTDMGIYGALNEVYKGYFNEPYPAREVVCVKALPLNAEIEMSMVAFKD